MSNDREVFNIVNLEENKNKTKELLYLASPHLHPRIIHSLFFDGHLLNIEIDKKAPQKLVEKIVSDLDKYDVEINGKKIIINLEEKKLEAKPLDAYLLIAKDLKEVTNVFDYGIIEEKPSGHVEGLKIGNSYIKKIEIEKGEHLELFTYFALHHFLGTKSPQVELIKDKKNNVWMVSKDLSQTYHKANSIKNKKFEMSLSNENIDNKSIAKLLVLAIIFRLSDLHMENIGMLKGEYKTKLAIVDHEYYEGHFPDFSSTNSWLDLLKVLENDYIKMNMIQSLNMNSLIHGLAEDIPSVIQAVNAIFYPLTENKNREKYTFHAHQEKVNFYPKEKSFEAAIEKAYMETLEKLEGIEIDLYSKIRDSYTLTGHSIEQTLLQRKNEILKNGENLHKTVKLIQEVDMHDYRTIQEKALTNYNRKIIKELIDNRTNFSNYIYLAIDAAIQNKDQRFFLYLLDQKFNAVSFFSENSKYIDILVKNKMIESLGVIQNRYGNVFGEHKNKLLNLDFNSVLALINLSHHHIKKEDLSLFINNYIYQNQSQIFTLRDTLISFKNRDLTAKILNELSSVNQLNLFCTSISTKYDLSAGIQLYKKTTLLIPTLESFMKYRIFTFNDAAKFIEVLAEKNINFSQLPGSITSKMKLLLMDNLTAKNLETALNSGLEISAEEQKYISEKLNPKAFLAEEIQENENPYAASNSSRSSFVSEPADYEKSSTIVEDPEFQDDVVNYKLILTKLNDLYLDKKKMFNNPNLLHNFFGMQHTFAWQSQSQKMRFDGWKEIKTMLSELRNNNEKLDLIDYALTLDIFKEHRSNTELTKNTKETFTVSMLRELRKEIENNVGLNKIENTKYKPKN